MRSPFLATLVGCAWAQFSSPSKGSALEAGKQIDIQWNTAGLEAPISINLVPAGVAGKTVIAQQIAVDIQNVGLLPWTPDLTIAAFPSFLMVVIDSKARVVLSEEFAIASLVQQPALATRLVRMVTSTVATDNGGSVATQRVTSTSSMLLALPTEPIRLHMSGTQVVDALVTGLNEQVPEPTQHVEKPGQLEELLPLPGLESNEKPLGKLKPLPNVAAPTATSTTEPSRTEASEVNKNGAGTADHEKNQDASKSMQGGGSKAKDGRAKSDQSRASVKSVSIKSGNKNEVKSGRNGSHVKKSERRNNLSM
ncbi:hypothetical protein NOR_01268 [Metarhizium rileyi]|uniref:Uncharacterized protein n=1 Tax=Metarhizium rileyi (strain RCEF 4871) TaxID=1649241 RepID=A0A167IR06_METRR|nr:hypothetical protein NOR_01268 [Metarhizium rileyi RCEF 4871]